MHPLLIASIFVVTTASSAIVAVKYTLRPKQHLAPAPGPSWPWPPRSIEGSVALPDQVPEHVRPGLLESVKLSQQEKANALNRQVDDTIRRLILMN